MFKKIAGALLFSALLTSTPAMAATMPSAQAQAAPAIAAQILAEHGVAPTKGILSKVALEMGPGTSFLGVKKDDPMYAHKVEHYLHCTLKVIEMPGHECMHGMAE